MRTDRLTKTPAPYLRMASIAAEAESAGAYGLAARAWEAAARLARREVNRQWAEERGALCENAQRRGWGLSDDEEEK